MIEYSPSWEEIVLLISKIAKLTKKNKKSYNWIISLNRGGLLAGMRMSHLLGVRHGVLSVESYSGKKKKEIRGDTGISMVGEFKKKDRILLIDDIADSGESLVFAVQRIRDFAPQISSIDTATIHYKPKSVVEPTYIGERVDNDVWINYPWESSEETTKKKKDAAKQPF
jgi:hypoxanthine phosphoribosyltransferase